MVETAEDIQKITTALAMGREKLASYGCLIDHNWRPSKFHLDVCAALEDAEAGKIDRLMISAPPQHGKSVMVSHMLPSWFLGRHPDQKVLTASYNLDHARLKGARVRDIMQSPVYRAMFQKSRIKGAVGAADFFQLTKGGEYAAFGIGSGGTGYSGNCVIIDDPVKDAEEARSKATQQAHLNWYRQVISTRAPPFGRRFIIILMTRWHTNDLEGQLLAQEGGRWKVLSYPALNEKDEPLWPESNQTFAHLDRIRRDDPRTFDAMYQQRPVPLEGSLLKSSWWKFYTQAPGRYDEVVGSWDLALTDTNDLVAGGVWGRIGTDYYLLDLVAERLDFSSTLKAIAAQYKRFPGMQRVLVENKANGAAAINMLKGYIPNLVPVNPEGGKESRANGVSGIIEAGHVYLPAISMSNDLPILHPKIQSFIDECSTFPVGAHDDMVDMMTQALIHMSTRARVRMPAMPTGWDG